MDSQLPDQMRMHLSPRAFCLPAPALRISTPPKIPMKLTYPRLRNDLRGARFRGH